MLDRVRRQGSVRFGQGGFQVDGGQQDEHVGLEGHDQQLEEHQPQTADERQQSEHIVDGAALGPEVDGADRRDGDQHVAGEHVGKQPDRQRERPQDDVGQELDRDQQDVHGDRNPGDVTHQLEEAEEAVLLDADDHVDEPDHHRQQDRDREMRRDRQLRDRNDAPQVLDQDEQEQRGKKPGPFAPVLATEDLDRDAVTNESVNPLADELHLAGQHGGPAGRRQHEADDQQRAQDQQHHRLDQGDDGAVADRVEEERMLDRRRLERAAVGHQQAG